MAIENSDDIRLIVKVAQLYYEQDMTQAQIARELGIYRTTISRLLNAVASRVLSPSPSTTTTTKICGWNSS
jgi:DNA-binding transcriptional regulator LsrR (DeoR family)